MILFSVTFKVTGKIKKKQYILKKATNTVSWTNLINKTSLELRQNQMI